MPHLAAGRRTLAAALLLAVELDQETFDAAIEKYEGTHDK